MARITKAIDWALIQGVTPFTSPGIDPNSFSARESATRLVNAQPSTLQALVQELDKEAELAVFAGGAIASKSGVAAHLTLDGLAHWLLAQARKYDSETTVRRLVEFLSGEYRDTLQILALAGITVEEKLDVTQDISLIPFSSLPRSYVSDYFSSSRDTAGIARPLPPTAALVMEHADSIQLFPDYQQPHGRFTEDELLTDELLSETARCLTLVGPSSPTPVVHWFQASNPERVPVGADLSSGSRYFAGEISPSTTVMRSSGEDIRELVERYLALEASLKKKLAVPVQRLNRALKRQDVVDRAIELGVALEALLVEDRDHDAPISYLLRIRGAWLAGGTLEERKENYKLLRDNYGLRSRAVHSGTISEQGADETLRNGSTLCANLIRRVIQQGHVPKWDDLILTPNLGLLSE